MYIVDNQFEQAIELAEKAPLLAHRARQIAAQTRTLCRCRAELHNGIGLRN